jgi:hypothetical protein
MNKAHGTGTAHLNGREGNMHVRNFEVIDGCNQTFRCAHKLSYLCALAPVSASGVVMRPNKPLSDPSIVAAQRAFRVSGASKNTDGSGAEYARLLTAPRRAKLERELGHEWSVLIPKDRSLLDGDAFARWNAAFKTALSDACAKIRDGLSDLESDLLACDVSTDAIENVMAHYYPDDGSIKPHEFNDAMFMVRAGHLSFVQARRLNELGHFFRPSVPPSLGALRAHHSRG